jgi:hypothetical protein
MTKPAIERLREWVAAMDRECDGKPNILVDPLTRALVAEGEREGLATTALKGAMSSPVNGAYGFSEGDIRRSRQAILEATVDWSRVADAILDHLAALALGEETKP